MTAVATDRPPDAALVVRRPARVRLLWLLATVAVLAAFMAASVAFGSRSVGWSDIWAALGGADDTLERAAVAKRIPRTLLAVVIGAALGLSGAVMQGVTRNPLADPGILGVNMGASLSVVTAVAGPIAFVGLIVPHAWLLVGVDHRWLLPFSALTGAALLTFADVAGRVVARPSDIEVGIVTALIGAPFFIHIVRMQKVREL